MSKDDSKELFIFIIVGLKSKCLSTIYMMLIDSINEVVSFMIMIFGLRIRILSKAIFLVIEGFNWFA
jgi:hypothetical protein